MENYGLKPGYFNLHPRASSRNILITILKSKQVKRDKKVNLKSFVAENDEQLNLRDELQNNFTQVEFEKVRREQDLNISFIRLSS